MLNAEEGGIPPFLILRRVNVKSFCFFFLDELVMFGYFRAGADKSSCKWSSANLFFVPSPCPTANETTETHFSFIFQGWFKNRHQTEFPALCWRSFQVTKTCIGFFSLVPTQTPTRWWSLLLSSYFLLSMAHKGEKWTPIVQIFPFVPFPHPSLLRTRNRTWTPVVHLPPLHL